MPVKNKGKNVAAVSLICVEHLLQARKRDLDSADFTLVLPVPVFAFW